MSSDAEHSKVEPEGLEIGAVLLGLVIAVALLYVGGWALVWGQAMPSSEALVAGNKVLAVRINGLYYGGRFISRFFDAPAISWGCLVLAVGCSPLSVLFSNDKK